MEQLIQSSQISPQQLEQINRYTRRDFQPEELFSFPVILCDNEVDRDGEAFSDQALEELAPLFVGKTGIFDHQPSGKNQTARIYAASVVEEPGRRTSFGAPYRVLRAHAYMVRSDRCKDLILEIESGIKKEVSVGCRMGRRSCSICGADLADGYCGHTPGQDYGGKTCHVVLEQPEDAYEWSFVAVPAQKNAGVTKQFQQGKATGERPVEEVLKAFGADPVTLSPGEQLGLLRKMEALEQKAGLGQTYLDSLKQEVIKLSFLTDQGVEEKAFRSVVEKMDLDELLAFRKAYASRMDHGVRQLAPSQEEQLSQNDSFKI